MPGNIKETWGIEPDLTNFPQANFPLGEASEESTVPPILELPNFLSKDECAAIRNWASYAIENGAEECGEYLNARVNQEVEEKGASEEGAALINEFDLDSSSLNAQHKGGFRIRLSQDIIHQFVKQPLLDILGMSGRSLVFEEGQWIRPTPRQICVRDQTVVLYSPGNGVPPHVDGKDATLLVYLSDGKKPVVQNVAAACHFNPGQGRCFSKFFISSPFHLINYLVH